MYPPTVLSSDCNLFFLGSLRISQKHAKELEAKLAASDKARKEAEAKALASENLQSKLEAAEEALKEAQDKAAAMKEKIEQIDARETAIIKRLDEQSEKFWGMFFSCRQSSASSLLHPHYIDSLRFCSRKNRGEVHQEPRARGRSAPGFLDCA